MSLESLPDWQPHLSMEAAAAATLLGLVFVAASINLRQIVTTPALPGRVVESVGQFVQVLFISMLMAVPRQSAKTLSVEILFIASCSWTVQMVAFVRYRRARLANPIWRQVARIGLSHLATIPFIVAGVRLWLGLADSLYWTVPGFLFSFFAGLVSAWILLINVGRRAQA